MKNIIHIISSLLPSGPMDCLGVGIIDFKTGNYESVEAKMIEGEISFSTIPELYFDLASLTKPLTNSLFYFLNPQIFDPKMILCLNHRGGLPAWGLLAKNNWREQILSYPVTESETLYSDFSSLRVMLEIGKKNLDQKVVCQSIWDKETVYWTDLKEWYAIPQNGYKNSEPNVGKVHDPNAWTIKSFCSHAGLFSTVDGLCRTLLQYQIKTDFLSKIKSDLGSHSHRFSFGWDRVVDPHNTLAGMGCGPSTFGHLGFTGTSIWIDPDSLRGHVILSNATKYSWYNKSNLNDMRRAIGEVVWKGDL